MFKLFLLEDAEE